MKVTVRVKPGSRKGPLVEPTATPDGGRLVWPDLAKGASMKNECDLWMNLSRISYDERADANQYGNGLADYWNVFLEFKKARNVETGAKVPMHFHGDTLTFTDDDMLAKKYLEIESKTEV